MLTDAFSRRLLAVFLSFDPSSYRSCMMVLRECVRRHGRFPQSLVVDGGKEFESVYFDTLLARFECTKKTRPPAKARFGSVCERLFGTSNTHFIHNLAGNTQITKNVRQVTKSVDPKRHAGWTLSELHKALCAWAYEVYETIPHLLSDRVLAKASLPDWRKVGPGGTEQLHMMRSFGCGRYQRHLAVQRRLYPAEE